MSALLERLAPDGLAPAKDAFAELRRHAQSRLMQHGFPDLKTEAWKYTPLRLLEKRAIADSPASGAPAPRLPFEAHVLFFDQGRLDPASCSLPEGVQLEPLSPDDLGDEDHGGRAGAFGWLNLARFEQGWKLVISGRVERPLVIATSTGEDFAGAVHPRILVELEEGASATVLETLTDRGAGLINSVLEVRLGQGASLCHLVHRQAAESAVIQRVRVNAGAGADYRFAALDLGGRLSRTDLEVNLDAPGSRGEIDGAVVLDGRTHVDYHTTINHHVGGTDSRELMRCMAGGTAVGVFNGRIFIAQGADNSHSDLHTGNLLLSDSARINTKPELEILAEEVTAAHGATIGRLNEDAVFYMRTRGLDEAGARSLLMYGFAAAPLENLEPESIRDWLLGELRSALIKAQ